MEYKGVESKVHNIHNISKSSRYRLPYFYAPNWGMDDITKVKVQKALFYGQ